MFLGYPAVRCCRSTTKMISVKSPRLFSPARAFLGALVHIGISVALAAENPAVSPTPKYPNFPSETPDKLEPATGSFDFVKREEMIPMRDGIKLPTIILIPRGAKAAPILLTRTPCLQLPLGPAPAL